MYSFRSLIVSLSLVSLSVMIPAAAFTARTSSSTVFRSNGYSVFALKYSASTVEAPTREKTEIDKKQRTGRSDTDDSHDEDEDGWDYPDLEYLQDSAESREMDDPFHILLLGSTFEKPKVTVTYVSGSLEYVLGMPKMEAVELASFAEEQGMSCLGTWPREECLSLGKQLQVRDIVCRVVPFAEGGHRGWQAKDASGAASNAGRAEGWQQ